MRVAKGAANVAVKRVVSSEWLFRVDKEFRATPAPPYFLAATVNTS
jgi:hypothetical protein